MVLSLMSEEECVAFVKENGISLPAIYENEAEWGPFVKQVIIMAEKDTNVALPISYAVKIEVAEEICALVNAYYGITPERALMTSTSGTYTVNPLTDSEVYSVWSDGFEYYNCYGFAIETYEKIDPGHYEYNNNPPEDMERYVLDLASSSIEDIRDKTIADLETEGKERVFYQTNAMDTSNLCINETIICVRRGPDDYHFMRYTSDGWLHKPGTTQILRYLGTPTYGELWTNEHVAYDIENYFFRYYPESYTETVYNSTIYFISYNGHSWSYTSNQNGTHTKTCSICDDAFQYSCNLTYSYIGDSMHSAVCTDCGYGLNGLYCSYEYQSNSDGTHTKTCTACNASEIANCDLYTEYSGSGAHATRCTYCDRLDFASCTGVLTHYEDETLGDAHKTVCRDCGNDMGGTGEACTIDYVFVGTIDGVNHHARFCTECGYRKSANISCIYKNSDYCRFCGTHKDRLQAVALHL